MDFVDADLAWVFDSLVPATGINIISDPKALEGKKIGFHKGAEGRGSGREGDLQTFQRQGVRGRPRVGRPFVAPGTHGVPSCPAIGSPRPWPTLQHPCRMPARKGR